MYIYFFFSFCTLIDAYFCVLFNPCLRRNITSIYEYLNGPMDRYNSAHTFQNILIKEHNANIFLLHWNFEKVARMRLSVPGHGEYPVGKKLLFYLFILFLSVRFFCFTIFPLRLYRTHSYTLTIREHTAVLLHINTIYFYTTVNYYGKKLRGWSLKRQYTEKINHKTYYTYQLSVITHGVELNHRIYETRME